MRAYLVAALVMVCIGAALSAGATLQAVNPEDLADMLRTLQASSSADPPTIHFSEDGYVDFLGAPAGGFFVAPAPSTKASSPEDTARRFLQNHGAVFGIANGQIAFATKSLRTLNGTTYVRLDQEYGGVKVLGGQVVVQVDGSGGIRNVVSGAMRDTRVLDTGAVGLTAGISSETSLNRARTQLASALGTVSAGAFESLGAPELLIFAPSLLKVEGPTRLVWRVTLRCDTPEMVAESVFIDAQSGEMVFHYSLIDRAKNRVIYNAKGSYNDPGNPVREEGDPATGVAAVDKVYDYLGDTYDFYFQHYGRDSYDDDGSAMVATVNLPVMNAYWFEYLEEMGFGVGWEADDIVAHELTHGVTQSTSNLIYFGEPGAINESFSDIWGEFVDLTNGRGNDSEEVRWLVSEDLAPEVLEAIGADAPVPGIRSMKDPTIFGDPDRYNSPYWRNTSSYTDNGGVHSNSGVGNKLAYLLTDGDTFNGQTVTGMGIDDVANLFYAAQLSLPEDADYNMLYLTLGAASVTLGFTFEERLNIARAGRAVEIEPTTLATSGLQGFRATPTRDNAGNAVIAVSWTPPSTDLYSQVILLRSALGFVEDPSLGVQLFAGKGDRYLDTNLHEGVEYFYTLIADLTTGLPQIAFARATAGQPAPETLTEAFTTPGVPGVSTPIDLSFTQILYTPVGPPLAGLGQGSGGGNYSDYEATIRHGVNDLPVPHNDGDGGAYIVTLTDNGGVSYGLSRSAFPFFGRLYSQFYIASNGYISFQPISMYDSANFPSLAAHFSTPRISYLFSNLTPNGGGVIWARELEDRVVLCLENIPEYAAADPFGSPSWNTVQVELFFSGHIRCTYREVGVRKAVVGLSDGNGAPVDPAELFDGVRSVSLLSDLSELPEVPGRLSIDPVAPQTVETGALATFVVRTTIPFGTVARPALTGIWDGPCVVPFADNGNGTGTFYWQTGLDDAGMYTLRVRAVLGNDDAFQDIRINVGDIYLPPQALNLRLSSGTPFEDPTENRLVKDDRSLFADYDYWHPQLTLNPALFAEGPSLIYWYRNNQVVSSLTNNRTVPAVATRPGDWWYFRVLPLTVSYIAGESVQSPIVTISGFPEVLSVTPSFGAIQGGDTVRITGSRLSAPLAVKFGGVAGSQIRSLGDGALEVRTPLHRATTVEVTVETSVGTGRLGNAFTFQEDEEEPPPDKAGAEFGCGLTVPGGGLDWGDVIAVGATLAGLLGAARLQRLWKKGVVRP